MTKTVTDSNIIGKVLTGIYESRNQSSQSGILGTASFFSIVIELNGVEHYELGAHGIVEWDYREEMVLCENSNWAEQNNIEVIGQKIKSILKKDEDDTELNTLSLLLENGAFVEHEIGNGDQLFIGDYKTDYE
jgi:hypothetical protein